MMIIRNLTVKIRLDSSPDPSRGDLAVSVLIPLDKWHLLSRNERTLECPSSVALRRSTGDIEISTDFNKNIKEEIRKTFRFN